MSSKNPTLVDWLLLLCGLILPVFWFIFFNQERYELAFACSLLGAFVTWAMKK